MSILRRLQILRKDLRSWGKKTRAQAQSSALAQEGERYRQSLKAMVASLFDNGETQPALPRAAVIYGPGCGLGNVTAAIAQQIGAELINADFSAATAKAVDKQFRHAHATAASEGESKKIVVLYLHGLDCLTHSSSARESVQALVRHLRELEVGSNLMVLTEVSHLNLMPNTLLQGGCFDVQIEVEKPEFKGRVAIFHDCLRNARLPVDKKLKSIFPTAAVILEGEFEEEWSLELEEICQECAILAEGLYANQIHRAIAEATRLAEVARAKRKGRTVSGVTPEQLYLAIENQRGNL